MSTISFLAFMAMPPIVPREGVSSNLGPRLAPLPDGYTQDSTAPGLKQSAVFSTVPVTSPTLHSLGHNKADNLSSMNQDTTARKRVKPFCVGQHTLASACPAAPLSQGYHHTRAASSHRAEDLGGHTFH